MPLFSRPRGLLGTVLGRSWTHLGRSLAFLGRSWAVLGANLGAILARSWVVLGLFVGATTVWDGLAAISGIKLLKERSCYSLSLSLSLLAFSFGTPRIHEAHNVQSHESACRLAETVLL